MFSFTFLEVMVLFGLLNSEGIIVDTVSFYRNYFGRKMLFNPPPQPKLRGKHARRAARDAYKRERSRGATYHILAIVPLEQARFWLELIKSFLILNGIKFSDIRVFQVDGKYPGDVMTRGNYVDYDLIRFEMGDVAMPGEPPYIDTPCYWRDGDYYTNGETVMTSGWNTRTSEWVYGPNHKKFVTSVSDERRRNVIRFDGKGRLVQIGVSFEEVPENILDFLKGFGFGHRKSPKTSWQKMYSNLNFMYGPLWNLLSIYIKLKPEHLLERAEDSADDCVLSNGPSWFEGNVRTHPDGHVKLVTPEHKYRPQGPRVQKPKLTMVYGTIFSERFALSPEQICAIQVFFAMVGIDFNTKTILRLRKEVLAIRTPRYSYPSNLCKMAMSVYFKHYDIYIVLNAFRDEILKMNN